MIEFETSTRLAAGPVRAHEGALAAIALPYGAPDMRRNAALSHGSRALPSLTGRGPEFPFLELHDQGIEGAVEDLSYVPVGNGMAEQRLGISQLFVRAFGDRQLDMKPPRRVLRHRNLRTFNMR